MKEYFYMFSQGQYSDYCVGGLYKSTQVLTEDWFGEYLKNKLIENHPEHRQFIENLLPDIHVLQGDSWKEDLWKFLEMPLVPNWLDQASYNSWCNVYHTWKKSFNTDFIKIAVEEGILEYVEYEEIWSH